VVIFAFSSSPSSLLGSNECCMGEALVNLGEILCVGKSTYFLPPGAVLVESDYAVMSRRTFVVAFWLYWYLRNESEYHS
jgi:hypothetical protein